MAIIRTHIVPPGTAEERLSDYARRVFDIIPSRNGVKKAIKRGEILLDGQVRETGALVRPGCRLDLLETGRSRPKEFRLAIEIVYSDRYLAVINKPPGIAVNGNRFRTVENALLGELGPTDEPDRLPWARPVHRLDSPTGGLLLVARTAGASVSLGRQFQERQIAKRYRTVVTGRTDERGVISIPLDGQEAVTEYTLVRCVPSIKNGWLSLLDVQPLTGRTHQIRRHMAACGHPVLGDRTYGAEGMILRSKGLFLWAVELSFVHPVDGNTMDISIDMPPKFTTFLDREERRWKRYNA